MSLRAALAITALGLMAPLPVRGQSQDFCEIKEIKVESLTNAVRIRIVADGLLSVSANSADFWGRDEERGTYRPKPQTRLPIVLSNVRVGGASLVEVGRYPVSHLEFGLSPGARQDVGLVCTLVLFRPAALTFFSADPYSWDGRGLAAEQGLEVSAVLTQRQNELLITVTSDRPNEPEPQRPAFKEAEPQLDVSGSSEKITIHAVNADIHALAESISALAGAPIYVDDAVRRKVTCHLEDMSPDRALDILASGYALSLWHEGQTHFLSLGLTDSAAAYATAQSRTVPLRYLRPDQTRDLLPDVLLMHVRPNTDANAVTITGSPPVLDRVERDLRALDLPSYHTRIRAWIVSTEGTDESVRRVLAGLSGGTTQWQGGSAGTVRLDVAERQARRILAELRALRSQRRLRIDTVPAVQAVNGQQATMFVGQDVYYWRFSGRRRQQIRLSSVPAGALLEVTPRTSGDWVNASVRVESSVFQEMNRLGPLIARRRASGTVRMASGDLLVVGGLRVVTTDKDRRTPMAAWPLQAPLAGRSASEDTRETWILMQARASISPLKDEPGSGGSVE